jgi:transposase
VYVPADQTQYDFKDVKAIVAGEEEALHLFQARLSCSTAWFVHCYRTEDQPALFEGFLRAGVEFGAVTRDGVFDNASTAVDKVLRGRHRKVNPEFAAFSGSLALSMQFAAPGKGVRRAALRERTATSRTSSSARCATSRRLKTSTPTCCRVAARNSRPTNSRDSAQKALHLHQKQRSHSRLRCSSGPSHSAPMHHACTCIADIANKPYPI